MQVMTPSGLKRFAPHHGGHWQQRRLHKCGDLDLLWSDMDAPRVLPAGSVAAELFCEQGIPTSIDRDARWLLDRRIADILAMCAQAA